MMKSKVSFLSVVFVFGMQMTCPAEEYAPMFPFAISSETRDNATDFSSWNPVPAGKFGFIRSENGHFSHDHGRIVLWGTNLCFSANFPEKEQAERLAARLARFGFNCVRLHHMDARDIWGGEGARSKTILDPDRLDKLDHLVFQLKQRGIYVNINLHVSRTMDDRDGFPAREKRPRYDKGLDNFYPALIDVQKRYARDLLTHVNPYTGTAYRDEPAVAMIEINNENSVVSQWTWGGLDRLPEPYATEFRGQWNDYLKRKYKTTEAAKKAWGYVDRPLGDELLDDAYAEPKNTEAGKWAVEGDDRSKFKKSSDGKTMRFELERPAAVHWLPMLYSGAFELEAGKPYTVSFRARADKPMELSLSNKKARPPWEKFEFQVRVALTTQWKEFSFVFVPTRSDEKVRFDLNDFEPGVVELADMSFRQGGRLDIPADWSVERGTVPLATKNDTTLPLAARNDFCDFVLELEKTYWFGMTRFLKEDLKVRQPVCGTQLRYGALTTQAVLDYVDNHLYWNHPKFPRREWDPDDWYVEDRALVDHLDREILPQLANVRVHGKPYVVSEFDAPFPNRYAAEALPILAAFGRFQDWDGIFHFAYSHDKNIINTKKTTSFFDMVGNTVKLVHLPACVALFRRGDLEEARATILAGMTAEEETEHFKRTRDTWHFGYDNLRLDPRLALLHQTGISVRGERSSVIPTIPNVARGQSRRFVSDTNQWQAVLSPDRRTGGHFSVDTPNTKLFTGFGIDPKGVRSTRLNFDGVEIRFTGRTRLDWGTISILSIDGNGFDPKIEGDGPVRILVAATGMMENTGMKIKCLEDDKITLESRDGRVYWGEEPVRCEAVPMEITFEKAKTIRCYPLDEAGDRREPVPANDNRVRLKPEYETLWYEVELH